MRCTICGEELDANAKVCPNCGTPIESKGDDGNVPEQPEGSNKKIIIGTLIGVAGIAALLSVMLLRGNKPDTQHSGDPESVIVSSNENEVIDDTAAPETDDKAEESVQEAEAEAKAEEAIQEAEAETKAEEAAQEVGAEAMAEESVQETAVEPDEGENASESKQYYIPEKAMYYNGHHYYIYNDVKTEWSEVTERCEERGGYPAVINDEEENRKLYRYMISMGYDQAFIGLAYDLRKDEWSYKMGDDSDYRDWGENSKGVKEPNNANGVEYNVEFDVNMQNGCWNDAAYGGVTYTPDGAKYKDRYAYICEWDQ